MEWIWIIESGFIVVAGLVLGLGASAAGVPVNPATGEKARKLYEGKIVGQTHDVDALRDAIEAGDFSALMALDPSQTEGEAGDDGLQVILYEDAKDPDFVLITVGIVEWRLDKDEDLEDKAVLVIENMFVTPAQMDGLKAHFV